MPYLLTAHIAPNAHFQMVSVNIYICCEWFAQDISVLNCKMSAEFHVHCHYHFIAMPKCVHEYVQISTFSSSGYCYPFAK